MTIRDFKIKGHIFCGQWNSDKGRNNTTVRAKKVIPWVKFDISGIVANFSPNFSVFRGEFRPHVLQISLQYLVAFENYNYVNLMCIFQSEQVLKLRF